MINPDDMLATGVYGSTMGVGMGGAFLAFRWFATFLAGRVDKKEAVLDEGLNQLIAELKERIKEEKESRVQETERRIQVEAELRERLSSMQEDLDECKKRHAESEAQVAKLSRLMQASGEIRDQVQVNLAAERYKQIENQRTINGDGKDDNK